MIASIFPLEAKSIALVVLMPLFRAVIKLISELKGRIVAAKKAVKNSASSAIFFAL